MNYTNKNNDTLVEMNNAALHQALTHVGHDGHGGHGMLDYGSMGDIIMDNSYFNADSMDLPSNFDSMTLFPANTIDINQQQSKAQYQQPPQSSSPSSSLDSAHISSAPIVKSQASLVKDEDLWSPPSSYNPPSIPLPTGAIQSWPAPGTTTTTTTSTATTMNGIDSNNSNSTDNIRDPFVASQQYQQSGTTSSQWCNTSSFSPSYQDMMLSDIYPSPVPTLMQPHYNDGTQLEDIKPQVPPPVTVKKANSARRSLPRRHTVSTVYNAPPELIHSSSAFGNHHHHQQQQQLYHHQQPIHQQQQQPLQQPIHQQQQQPDPTQQAKMRKMLKARRHRSLGRLEVPSHYLTKLDTAYHAVSPSSLSCGTSRCGSPLSAECLSNEQHLNTMAYSMDQVTQRLMQPSFMPQGGYHHHHQQQQYQQQVPDQVGPTGVPTSYPSFLIQPIYHQNSSPPATASLPSAPTVQSQHLPPHAHLQMMDDDMYSMAATSHTSTNTAPTSPVIVPVAIDDESEDADDYSGHQSLGNANGPHTCQWGDCRLEFSLLDHLIEHTKTLHIGSGKPLYYCRWKDCARGDKPFTKRHKMHNHLRTHTGERPYVCTEEGCGKRFSRPDSMATHTKIHTNIRPYACQFENCEKAYYHLRSLRKHEKSHEVPPPLPTASLMDRHLSVLELKD